MCTIMLGLQWAFYKYFAFLFGTHSQSLHSSVMFYALVPTEMQTWRCFLNNISFHCSINSCFVLKFRAGFSMMSKAVQPYLSQCNAMKNLCAWFQLVQGLNWSPSIVQCYMHCSHTGAFIITLQQGTLCWLYLFLTARFLPALKINKPKVSRSSRKHREGIWPLQIPL